MAWPKLDYVTCVGFDRALLPIIKRACDEKLVIWSMRSLGFLDTRQGTFDWAGCTWQMDELNEWVISIILEKGTQPAAETLTAALLGAKIETS